MSSLATRTSFKNFITTNAPTETLIDLTGHYEEFQDLIEESGIGPEDPWVGIEFVGSDEIPITVGSTNVQGKYRETGAVYIHVVDIAKLGVSDIILTRAEALRDLFRGQRIDSIFIESVTPVNFGAGATLRFESGYMAGSFIIGYEKDLDL